MSGTESELKRIAVFCGANAGTRPEYLQAAKNVGEELVKRKIGLVYGGEFRKHDVSKHALPFLSMPPDSCRWKCRYDGGCGTDSKPCLSMQCTCAEYLVISADIFVHMLKHAAALLVT